MDPDNGPAIQMRCRNPSIPSPINFTVILAPGLRILRGIALWGSDDPVFVLGVR